MKGSSGVGVYGEELDRRDPERLEVVEHRVVREPFVRATELARHVGVEHGEPLHVRLVEDRVRPRDVGARVALPVERAHVDHDRPRHERRAVLEARGKVVLPGLTRVAEHGLRGVARAPHSARVRVDQELLRVEPVAGLGLVGAEDPVAVLLARAEPLDPAVEHVHRAFAERDSGLASGLVEEAKIDARRVLAEDREVYARRVRGRAEGVGLSGA
jgi:hypothetical protein